LVIEIHPDIIGAKGVVQWLGALKDLGYRPDWLFDQERDLPLRWRFLKPETPTMDELISDPRIHSEPQRPLMAFFSRDARAHVCPLPTDSAAALSPQLVLAAQNSTTIYLD
jgi:hypothetical protein